MLTLFAHPKQGFKPLTVVFEAEIINYKGKEDKYSCLTEKWDFGDGSKSSHQANCKEKLEFKNKFIISHTYYGPGKYRAQFVLGDNKLRSDVAWINVLIAGI
ncbi:MAG: hypothetical protein A2Y62_16850 [Candidatus Fischerbacteria bacterium RBG_13_37_8]|uniref:PKD domain-containing protein n=1 Tax=Candidatus Fischerbacteria bacterium RBG_13_37_8 TaxID=1817863 RepID=A0A1F5V9Z8_9BACT|nr:MAG: hypothetical protein A2Y62_16850 [Candidatus Fischerbacteria bacterium RBG_13_37_8]